MSNCFELIWAMGTVPLLGIVASVVGIDVLCRRIWRSL